MFILGLSGGFGFPDDQFTKNLPVWFFHDSAACLIHNNDIVAAIEEERINRIKHTNMFPVNSIKYCLKTAGIDLRKIARIAYFFQENYVDNELNLQYVERPWLKMQSAREIISTTLSEIDGNLDFKNKIRFVSHHKCHAVATYLHSGFKKTLIGIFDGNGEDESVSIFSADTNEISLLKSYPVNKSLGHLYSTAIQLLGYKLFDEYKVMGLAPYGDAKVYRNFFQTFFTLKEKGDYEINFESVRSFFLQNGFLPRREGAKFEEKDANFAAALQESLEILAIHILKYWAEITGLKNLCLAGGVAHNSTMNGMIARSNIFQKVFIHPASHDAGAAIGAALETFKIETNGSYKPVNLKNVYWGSDIGTSNQQHTLLKKWRKFFDFQKLNAPCVEAAKHLAEGKIIGWVQGSMEYGPRALGNRSILADPRFFESKNRINKAIKKRETYRPFAPAVLLEKAHLYFQMPSASSEIPFMGMTVKIKPEKRNSLAAVNHVDDTARVQTVSKKNNPTFYRLILEFEKFTGVPIILNTSFNTSVEPIVRTSGDALVCFLLSELDYLFIGDWQIKRKNSSLDDFLKIIPEFDENTRLSENINSLNQVEREISFSYTKGKSMQLSPEMFLLLKQVDGKRSISECLIQNPVPDALENILSELKLLLEGRFLKVKGLNSKECF